MISIRFDKYFYLLDRLMPLAAGFVVCDARGMVIAMQGEPAGVAVGNYLHTGPGDQADNEQLPADVTMLLSTDGGVLLRRDISNSAGIHVGALLAYMGDELSADEPGAMHAFAGSIDAVASCISKEHELNTELDAMSQELAGRYEELNLVYDTNDDVIEYHHEVDTIKQLLRNCVEYLDVGLVALVSPAQDTIHYAVSATDPVSDPYPLVSSFATDLYTRISVDQTCLIFNKVPDPQRAALSLDIPYKVLTCPVVNASGVVIAGLVCLNGLTRPDFFNSDKNLLDVMSRKVSKIIQVNHDAMTGLINLRAFNFVLQDAMESTRQKGVAYTYLNIDLDQLSVINDNLGRDAGDKAIKTVADLLKARLRTKDIISYLGEGRFGILLEVNSLEQGLKVAENLCAAVVTTPFSHEQGSVELSVSVGMTMVGPDAKTTDAILEAAELARDAAKKAGRNQVKVYKYDNAELTERKEQMQWVGRIQKALRDNRFEIHCQEIRPAAASDEKYHFEILVRMTGEEGEIIAPNDFIPTAERYNLMTALDRWVIDSTFALLQANGLAQHPREGVVSINLSGQSLADAGLVGYIGEMFSKYLLLPDCICFEITETVAFGNMELARDIINQVRTMGCHFSLDDFGTGLSSFSYLKELPVDYLKIDGSFVRHILDDSISHVMVSSINQVGQVMGLKTVAEFVESSEIAEELKVIGVDYLQGYSICKPIPLQEYLDINGLASVTRTA